MYADAYHLDNSPTPRDVDCDRSMPLYVAPSSLQAGCRMPSCRQPPRAVLSGIKIDLMMQWHVIRRRAVLSHSPLTENNSRALHCETAMLRRAVPRLIRICNIVGLPAHNTKFPAQIECYGLHQSRDRSVAAAVVRSWVGPSVFQRGFAARPGTLLVHFPLAQTGEGAPAVDLSPPLGWAPQSAPPGLDRRTSKHRG